MNAMCDGCTFGVSLVGGACGTGGMGAVLCERHAAHGLSRPQPLVGRGQAYERRAMLLLPTRFGASGCATHNSII